MQKALRNGGIAMLLITFALIEILGGGVKELAPFLPSLEPDLAKTLKWALTGVLVLSFAVGALGGRKLIAGKPVEIRLVIPLGWLVLGFQPLVFGLLLAVLTGDTRWGVGLMWLSLPWLVFLIWRSRQVDTTAHSSEASAPSKEG